MPNDKPIAYAEDGRPLYDNAATVVCVIIYNEANQVLAVRRGNEPGKGLLGLPGGHQMKETWQEAGARELYEETGVKLIAPDDLDMQSMETDEYGKNLVIAVYPWLVDEVPEPMDCEVLECVWVDNNTPLEDWAFPRHHEAVLRYIEESS